MMISSFDASKCVDFFESQIERDSPPVDAKELIRNYLLGLEADITLDQCAELAEDYYPAVRDEIERRVNVGLNEHTDFRLELFGEFDDYVRGTSSLDARLSDHENLVRRNRVNVERMHSELRGLDGRQFEFVCREVLRFLDCSSPYVTKSSGDGGIDFIGRLSLTHKTNNRFPFGGPHERLSVWLVGQAKRYSDPIGPSDIRELIGSVELLRSKLVGREMIQFQVSPFDAIVQIFLTTAEFTSGSRDLLSKTGVFSMSGAQLSTFLCDRSFAIGADGAFDLDEFNRRIAA